MSRDDLQIGLLLAEVRDAARRAAETAEETAGKVLDALQASRDRDADVRALKEEVAALQRAQQTPVIPGRGPSLTWAVAVAIVLGVVILSLGGGISLILHPQFIPLVLQVVTHGQPSPQPATP